MSRCILYRCEDDPKTVNKTPVQLAELEQTAFRFIEPMNELRPTFVIRNTSTGDTGDDETWIKANYVYLPKLKRYYYATLTTRNDGLIQVDCEVDPLYTYKDSLLNSNFEIARSEKYNSEWYIDSDRPIQANHMIYKVKLGRIPEDQSSGAKNYVLTVAGGNA